MVTVTTFFPHEFINIYVIKYIYIFFYTYKTTKNIKNDLFKY